MIASKYSVPAECFTGQERMVKLENGQIYMYPVAEVEVESPYFSEMTTAVCIRNPFYDLMIGNVSGTVFLYQDGKYTCSEACAVHLELELGDLKENLSHKRCLDLKSGLQLTAEELRKEQLNDPSFKEWRGNALHWFPVG